MARRSKRNRSLAAIKGWRTRRANAKIKGTHKPSKKSRKTSKRVHRKMWRVTVGAAYEIRPKRGKGKNKKRKGSPAKASYMIRAWFSDYASAVNAQDDLEERAIAGRDEVEDSNKNAFHTDNEDEVNVEISTVEYDERLLDTVEETNEI
jgi:hypothetical protein